jgi:hypothetical protein
MFTHILGKSKKPSFYSKHTDCNCFGETLDGQITPEIPSKTEMDEEETAETITKQFNLQHGKEHQIYTN